MLYHLTGVGNGKHSQNCAKLKFNKDKHIPKKDKQHSGGERNRGGQAFGKIATCFQNRKFKCKLTLHWSVVWSLWASGWSLWTVTRCACVRLRAWHLSVRPAGSLQTTCHRPSAASSPLCWSIVIIRILLVTPISCWACITTLILIFWKSGCYLHLSLLPQQRWKYYRKAEGDKDVVIVLLTFLH